MLRKLRFPGSAKYWEDRYRTGGDSGVGSYDKFASFKAEILNQFVSRHAIQSVIEFGCGDGNQLSLSSYPQYLGIDVSQKAIDICRTRFADDDSKQFVLMSDYREQTAELALSLDVIYHLVEDSVFEAHIDSLFQASTRYVIVYSSNMSDSLPVDGRHVRHRQFTPCVEERACDWTLIERIPNKYPYCGDYKTGSWSDFFVYQKVGYGDEDRPVPAKK